MLSRLRQWVKDKPKFKRSALFVYRMLAPFSGVIVAIKAIPGYVSFFSDWHQFRRAGGEGSVFDFYPRMFDRTSKTSIDTHYFFQGVWAFRRILASSPLEHVDVGSEVNFVGLLTTISRVTFVDIRPLALSIPNYRGLAGSVLDLPFATGSVHSLSSLHVIEHVGLGRYGDPIDPEGSVKAAREITRVLAPRGHIYVSMPIGRPRVQFNGQRVFSVKHVLEMFCGLRLVEMAVVDPQGRFQEGVDPHPFFRDDSGAAADYGLGMFEFEKVPG